MTEPTSPADPAAEATRRRKALYATLLLLIGLPIYLIAAALLVGWLTQPVPNPDGGPPERALHWALELLVYLGLGLIWAFPLKGLVRGIGRKSS